MIVMFVWQILSGWGSALEPNNTYQHKSLSLRDIKPLVLLGKDVVQDIIPFVACAHNLLTQYNGSCTISKETFHCEKLL